MVSVISSLSTDSDSTVALFHRSVMTGIGKALHSVNDFFHARTGPEGCLLGGWMRIAYAFLFIMDRLLWSLELDYFFYQSGVLPTRVTRSYSYVEPYTYLTIFQLAPESDWLVWAVNYLCLLQGILLLLGIAPRFQLACLVTFLASWEHQNDHAWDSQDVMLRFFGFLLCFLPLHRLTIYEWWQTRGMTKEQRQDLHKNDSWPMWPFRLWQIEICFIYAGAGLSKLSYRNWRNGLAVYYATYSNHFGGIFTPDFLFNRILPLKIACYGSLAVECLSWILVWPLTTRIPSIVSIVLLHVGIDLSMNMNIFEWLSILGWMVFLARPRAQQDEDSSGAESKPSRKSPRRRALVNLYTAAFIIIYGCEVIPFHHIRRMAPDALDPAFVAVYKAKEKVLDITEPWLHRLGIHQETWSMFSNPMRRYDRYEAFIRFEDETNAKWWSPDWRSMSWLELKRNRRRQLYFNNLVEFKTGDDGIEGHARLCEWIAEQYGKDVVRVKLVHHRKDAPQPSPDLGWFDPARVPLDELEASKVTHYIHYTRKACDAWASEGDCSSNAEFMAKRCAESCKGEYDDVENVKVGSRVLVYSKDDSAFYTASVLKIRDKKPERFYLKWDFADFGKEWFDLDTTFFSFIDEKKFTNSHTATSAALNNASHDEKEL